MSIGPRRYQTPNWSVTIVPKPWYIDVMTFSLVALWMLLTFGTIQMYGPSRILLLSAVVVLVVSVTAIYGRLLRQFKVGDWFNLDLRKEIDASDEDDDHPLSEEERKKMAMSDYPFVRALGIVALSLAYVARLVVHGNGPVDVFGYQVVPFVLLGASIIVLALPETLDRLPFGPTRSKE